MVFFHVGDEQSVRLTVNSKIWLYPVVTVPLTVMVIVWYFWPDSTDGRNLERWRKFGQSLKLWQQ